MKTETLQVPGASLYYEVRGSGPVLLMIPGGPMDADGFKDIADRLADDYTVVTYDCRGNSRSPMQGSWDDLTVGLFADDAHRLLDAVGTDQADVLGSSGGATYALDLVARYPGRVRTLVAHTGVSTDGKMFSNTGLPCNCSLLTGARSDPTSVKAGAEAPTAGKSPTVLIGFPRIVICAMRTVCQGREGSVGPGLGQPAACGIRVARHAGS